MNNKHIQNIVLAALFLAIGLVLPFFTGGELFGRMLLPLHIPVLLCGLMLGPKYGFIVGAILPIVRFLMIGHPPFPIPGLPMTFELAAYGAVIGLLYNRLPKKPPFLYASLVGAMLVGRVIWGFVMAIMSSIDSNMVFSLGIFWTGAFVNSISGIALQIVLIPALILALRAAGWRNEGEYAR
ncbi:MAG: ECF transporter S component [Defluviitaleaceae bacterium]|nr:ECF transporter S component [Defluviitaleaceae bacterium]